MSFKTIGEKLETILNTVKNAPNSGLAAVFNYEEVASDQYPYATICTGSLEEEILDTTSNEAVYNFIIRVIDVNKNKATMEANMRALADDIMAELRKEINETLAGTVNRVAPFKIDWKWDTENSTPKRYFEINVEVMTNYTI